MKVVLLFAVFVCTIFVAECGVAADNECRQTTQAPAARESKEIQISNCYFKTYRFCF